MAITPQELKIVLPQAEFVRQISTTGTTEVTKRVGLGGVTRSKFLTHAISLDLEGDITSPKLISALLGNQDLTIGVHDLQITGAVAESIKVAITAKDPLNFSTSLQAKGTATITPGTPTLPKELFTKSEGTIAINALPTEINELTVNAKRDVEAVYGGIGATLAEKMKPSNFKIGTWEYSADISVVPQAMSDAIKLWDPTESKWNIVGQFVDAVDNTHTFGFVLRGCIVSEASGDADSSSIDASRSIEAEGFEIGEVASETFVGDGTTKIFTLTGTPLADSVLVRVDGVYTAAFSVSNKVITLNSAPANGKSIVISYLKAVTL